MYLAFIASDENSKVFSRVPSWSLAMKTCASFPSNHTEYIEETIYLLQRYYFSVQFLNYLYRKFSNPLSLFYHIPYSLMYRGDQNTHWVGKLKIYYNKRHNGINPLQHTPLAVNTVTLLFLSPSEASLKVLFCEFTYELWSKIWWMLLPKPLTER